MLQLNFWISELAELTGVSTRTIRYYIEEGLLPQPEIQGKYAVFNDDYLIRLKLIKFLKDAYLPLKEIKKRLDSLMVQEMRDLVRKFEQEPTRALAELDIYPLEMNISLNMPAPQVDSAHEYIARVLNKNSGQVNEVRQRFNAPPSSPPAQVRAAIESWQRVELAPGVELNIRQPQSTARLTQLKELMRVARKILNREDPK